MTTRLYTLLENYSDESLEQRYTDKQKGAGYHGIRGGTHTVVYQLENYIGTILIQGTLAEIPGESDWVDIDATLIENEDSSNMTTATSRSFQGNFMWLRAKYQLTNGIIVDLSYNY
jgi:hypothetical protein